MEYSVVTVTSLWKALRPENKYSKSHIMVDDENRKIVRLARVKRKAKASINSMQIPVLHGQQENIMSEFGKE